ncbi:MAG: YigZ family protein [Eubacterium sp.]|nr:YigZ family protein [Eubacterium sp.]
MAGYRTILEGGSGELVEKKSRFLAEVIPASGPEEAEALVARHRKKYYDAKHHCFCYILGEKSETLRSSDDGEPQGTAGHPMLDVLKGAGITNAAAVVTRYFGGTLLGTGGLVRAYSGALREALKTAKIIEKNSGAELKLNCDYNTSGKVQYYIQQSGVPLIDTQYTDRVSFLVMVPDEEEEAFRIKMAEFSGGKMKIEELKRTAYAVLDGEVIF